MFQFLDLKSVSMQVASIQCVPNTRELLVMNSILIHTLIFSFLLLTGAAGGYGQSAGAPPIYEIKFQKGVFAWKGTVHPVYPCPANGPTECGNDSSTGLSLKGTKGMRVRFVLTSDTGDAVFSVTLPNREIMKDSSSRTSWTGTLPVSGDFPVYVYTNKSFSRYALKVYLL